MHDLISAGGDWLSANAWPVALAVMVVAVFAAATLGTDVVVTSAGISVVVFGRSVYTVPFGDIKRVRTAPMRWEISAGGFSFGNTDSEFSPWNRVLTISLNPFGQRIWVERKDGSLVVLAPSDREKLLQEVSARINADLLPGAEAVIAAEVARRKAEE